MSRPLVSVILPVFNAENHIGLAVESVLDQTLKDWELIAVDDGSTDNTPALLHSLEKRDSRIRILSTPHAGITAALNLALKEAQGTYIARMDADDISDPKRFEIQTVYLDNHPEIGLVGCRVSHLGSAETQQGYRVYVEWINALIEPNAIRLNRFVESPFAHPSMMFRSDLPARFGPYRDGDFPEDYELILRWMENGVEAAKSEKTLLRWRDTENRLSRKDPRYSPEAFYRCKAPYLALELKRALSKGRKELWVWGAGRTGRRRAALLEPFGVSPSGYIDIDPDKIGAFLGNRAVVGPEDLPSADKAFITGFVGNRGAREIIRQRLMASGRKEGRDFLFAA